MSDLPTIPVPDELPDDDSPEGRLRAIEKVVMLAREQALGAAGHCEQIWVSLIPQYRAALQATRPQP